MSHLTKINSLINNFELAIRLRARPGVVKTLFSNDMRILELGNEIQLPGRDLPDALSREIAQNLIPSATRSLILGLVDFRDELEKSSPDLWAVVYMLRCCYAHGVFTPTWKISKDYLNMGKVSLLIPTDISGLDRPIELVFDFPMLNGHPLDSAHHGGFAGLICIARLVLRAVTSYTGTTAATLASQVTP